MNAATPQRRNAATPVLLLIVWLNAGCNGTTQSSLVVKTDSKAVTSDVGDKTESDGRVRKHDFGIVRPGSKNKHRFVIENKSSLSWNVASVETTCSCTVLNSHSKVIKPFKAGVFDVEYKAPHLDGADSRTITVRFREGDAPELMFVVSAQVRPELSCDPKEIDFGIVAAGSKVERVIEIRNFDDSDWTGLDVVCDSDVFNAVVTEIPVAGPVRSQIRPRQSWRAVISTVPASMTCGVGAATLNVVAKSERQDWKKQLRVKLEIEPHVAVIPSAIFLGRTLTGQQVSRTFLLRFAQPKMLESAAEINVEGELAENSTIKATEIDNRTWKIALNLCPVQQGQLESRISVKFARSDIPSVEIPVRGVVE